MTDLYDDDEFETIDDGDRLLTCSGSPGDIDEAREGDRQDAMTGIDSERVDGLGGVEEQLPSRPFATDDYGPSLRGSGAAKMVDSAVAPLVAIARGYATVDTATLRDAAKRYGLGAMNSTAGRQLTANVGEYDAMMMPWYTPEDVTQAEDRRSRGIEPGLPRISALQIRPHELSGRTNAKGQRLKYDMLSGQPSVIGLHPATPASWLRGARVAFITEGAIKGDSALTALLRHNGISTAQLSVPRDGDQAAALTGLHDLMESVPVRRRVLILTLIGVGNWHHNPEWNSFGFRGKRVWVAFDGDVSSNRNVHDQASQLWTFLKQKKGATPQLLDLQVPTENVDGEAVMQKIGVDDYLSKMGNWRSLEGLARDDLPPRPQGDGTGRRSFGVWRTDEEQCLMYEDAETQDDFGQRKITSEPKSGLVGRVVAVTTPRTVTPDEEEVGTLSLRTTTTQSTAKLEFRWRERGFDSPIVQTVEIDAALLGQSPDQWPRRADLPAELLRHPEFPPSQRAWLATIKDHRREEALTRYGWGHMGWVPLDDDCSEWAFLLGSGVAVGADGDVSNKVHSVVDAASVRHAGSFGVSMPDSPEDAVEDLRAVLEALATGWKDQRIGALILAAALRPVIPIRPNLALILTGAKHSGKSLTASFIMAFWATRPGAWNENRLPGSPTDTLTSTERFLNKAPIWVCDDLAPDVDERRARSAESTTSQLVRNTFNQTARGRSNADGSGRPDALPRALLIITAENSLSVASATSRLMEIKLEPRAVDSETLEQLIQMRDKDGTFSRVTGALIQHVTSEIRRSSWLAVRERYRNQMSWVESMVKQQLGEASESARTAQIVASFGVALCALREYATSIDLDWTEYRLTNEDEWVEDLIGLAKEHHIRNSQSTPGRAVIEAIGGLLRLGRVHLRGRRDDNGYEELVGGSHNTDCIGFVRLGADKVTEIAMIDPTTAFAAARNSRGFEHLLPPGSKPEASWASVWEEGLAYTGWKREKGRGDLLRLTVDTGDRSGNGRRGLPIPLSTLLHGVPEPADGHEHDRSDEDDELEDY